MPITYPVHLDIFKLLVSLTETTDQISPALVNHHKQVSYIAYSIGKTLGLDEDDLRELAIAGALHDIGGLSLGSRLEALEFETSRPEEHAISGAILLGLFKPFSRVAELVRFHHVYWDNGAGAVRNCVPVSVLSHILHLADRIAVLLDHQEDVLQQVRRVVTRIRNNAGRMFVPEHVQAFQELAVKESFWLDIAEPAGCCLYAEESFFGTAELAEEDVQNLAALFSQIIDFRSRFTATHSSGVAAVAEALAGLTSLTPAECTMMKIAGLLHDIGKLAVPREILEKETPLTREDHIIIRRHPYFSRRILRSVPAFKTICTWSAYHHERLDGSGYPFHIKGEELPYGARILSVVDTFTALTEVRPYRTSVSGRGTLKILNSMVQDGKLDGDIVDLISRNIDEFNAVREAAQSKAYDRHTLFTEALQQESMHVEIGRTQ